MARRRERYELSRYALDALRRLGCIQGGYQERTLFEGIRLVPPGHYLIATDEHIQVRLRLRALIGA